MKKVLNIQKSVVIFGIPLSIMMIMVFLSKSSLFITNSNTLSIGITFDLLLIVPLVYFLLIRKTTIPKTTVVPFFIAGIVICSLIIPTKNQYYLDLFKTWVLPILELAVLVYIFYNVRKAVRHYKLNKSELFDFFTTLKKTCYELLPNSLVIPVVTDIAVFYYGFIFWKKRKLRENEYTYHKDSGTITLFLAIIFIIAIETVTLHFLLAKWNPIAAWVLTFLSIYSGMQLFGFLKSIIKRPIIIDNGKLYLRYAIMSESTIDLKNIETIEVSSKELDFNNEVRRLSFLGVLESHNIIIRLKEENSIIGLYGVKRKFKVLALYGDAKIEFQEAVNNSLKVSV